MNEEIILSNQGLVISIANKFKSFAEIQDLVSEGNVGLLKASKKYKEEKGKFSTFASWYIKGEILRYIEKENALSNYSTKQNKILQKVREELKQELEREPLPEELAEESSLSLKTVERIQATQNPLHLDEQVGETTIGAFITDGDLNEEMDEILLQDRIMEGLKTLNPRERKIIELTLEGYKSGEMDLGISEERIRQIKKEALEKLQVSQ